MPLYKGIGDYMHNDVEASRKYVEESSINEENKRDVLLLDMRNANNGVRANSRVLYLRTWFNFATFLGKPFRMASKEEIDGFIYDVKRGKLSKIKREPSPGYVNLYIVGIKKLYKMLYPESKDTPDIVKQLRVPWDADVGVKKMQKEDLLTPIDVMRMVAAVENKEWKALIKVLFETGFRVSELTSMTIGCVSFKENEAVVKIKASKTKLRSVLIIDSLPELADWVNAHPQNTNPDAPLWISRRGRQMGSLNVRYVVQYAARQAGITKRVTPHVFRHSIVSFRKRMGMVREELCMFAGWSLKSRMPERYSHFSLEDVFNRQRKQSGLPVSEPNDEVPLRRYEVCPTCQRQYPIGHAFCDSCNMPLDIRRRMEMEKEIQNQATLLENMKKVEPVLAEILPYLKIMSENKENFKKLVENLQKTN